jgi:hypothetical protein
MEFLKKLEQVICVGALVLGSCWLALAGGRVQAAGDGHMETNGIGRSKVTPPPPQ